MAKVPYKRGLPYKIKKKKMGAQPLRGTKILFCGRGLNVLHP